MTDFVKWEGLGNDFVVAEVEVTPERASALCDRRRGIGGDGVLSLLGDDGAGWRMVVLNADGSRPEMCGNGLRCVVGHLAARAGRTEGHLTIETDAGPRRCRFTRRDDGLYDVEATMGEARFGAAFDYAGHRFLPVEVGNPHAVAFVAAGDAMLDDVGPALERDTEGGVNVELCAQTGARRIDVVVWERGVGRTLACGTGACAVAAAAAHEERVPYDEPVEVVLPGGALSIAVGRDRQVRMTGPARRVFTGRLP